ncbi:MAG: class I SAM-dependent methyltransferase [Anaerolineaceae bacterium]|nr:class I SAM-dependent methyltransferase [Anaerolineaceae bacterium]
MKTVLKNEIEYGNWVPQKMILIPIILGITILMPGLFHWGFIIGGLIFLSIGIYFTIAWHLFSAKGGNIQDQVQELLVNHIDWQGAGNVLDIGCGNGPLTIKLAKRFPEANITGLDYWGKNWNYSIQVCEKNAQLAGVAERVSFQQGSAVQLPSEDNSYDLVVSNLTFHEVMQAKDKRDCIQEVLRVLKPGGIFVLQDLFLLKAYFGTPQELLDLMRLWGVSDVEFIRTCDEPFIPGLVKLPFMLGAVSILRGKK